MERSKSQLIRGAPVRRTSGGRNRRASEGRGCGPSGRATRHECKVPCTGDINHGMIMRCCNLEQRACVAKVSESDCRALASLP